MTKATPASHGLSAPGRPRRVVAPPILLALFLLALGPRPLAAEDSPPQAPPSWPQTSAAAFAKWSQDCLAGLRAAQAKAASSAPFVARGEVQLRQFNLSHYQGPEYPHYQVGFWEKDGKIASAMSIALREDLSEDSDILPIWHPDAWAPSLVSEQRYFRGEKSFELVPLDNSQGKRLLRYDYHRRLNNAIARIHSNRQPDQLRILLKYLEPAMDACLLAGQHLPPFPCARIAALPPRPALPAPVLRPAPPLTIQVVGMPKGSRLQLSLGDWKYDVITPNSNLPENKAMDSIPYILKPSNWFSNYREYHTLYAGFESPPRLKRRENEPGLLLGGTSIHADGRERGVTVQVTVEADGRLSVRSERLLPGLPGVRLQPDWLPSAPAKMAYLLINHSPQAIRRVFGATEIPEGLEIFRNGKWEPYYEKPKEKTKIKCANQTIVDPHIESGDWEYIDVTMSDSDNLLPGKYRYTAAYTTTMDSKCTKSMDLYEVSAEFEIKPS